jgi:hypothetical protein
MLRLPLAVAVLAAIAKDADADATVVFAPGEANVSCYRIPLAVG